MSTLLVSAYGCEPGSGSEQGVGWQWVWQLARFHQLHVITRANNRDKIEAALPEFLASRVVFHYYDTPAWLRGLKHREQGLYFYYFCWQLGIIPLVSGLKKRIHFDYAMHLTFGSLWMPTFLPFFDIPFIWGPIGGAEGVPRAFRSCLPWRERLREKLRDLLIATTRLNPLVFIPSSRAISILARTRQSSQAIPLAYRSKATLCLETAMEQNLLPTASPPAGHAPLKLIVSGRLVASKNALAAVLAMDALRDLDLELTLLGDGPEKPCITSAIQRLDLQDRVRLIPALPREQALELVAQADLFVFPSLREGGSWALMEALALGVPVICLDWAGMAVITSPECAIRLPVSSPRQFVQDLAQAIRRLTLSPDLRRRMGEAGRRRITEHFCWDAKGDFMEGLLAKLARQEPGAGLLERGQGEWYYSLANGTGKRWLLPKGHLRCALELYQPSGWKGLLLKAGLPILHRLPGFCLLLGISEKRYALRSPLKERLEAIWEGPVHCAWFGGTPGVHQKSTLEIFRGSQLLGYAKASPVDEIGALFSKEKELLEEWSGAGVEGIPRCLYLGTLPSGMRLFVQSTSKSFHSRILQHLSPPHWAFLDGLRAHTGIRLNLEESDLGRSLGALEKQPEWINPGYRPMVARAIASVRTHYGSSPAEFCGYHGDFTPWNTYLEQGRLHAFDMEYALRSCPPYMDACHFMTQTAIFSSHLDAPHILAAFQAHLHRPELSLSLYRCYLLEVLSRFLGREKGHPKGDIAHCIAVWLELLDLLDAK